MDCRIESESFCGPARRMGQNCRRHSQSYVEHDFGADNPAGHKISRLNTEAFFRRSYMQNKPNLRNDKMNINFYSRKDYEQKHQCENRKNEPKTNPKRTQNKPNQTQFQTGSVTKNSNTAYNILPILTPKLTFLTLK